MKQIIDNLASGLPLRCKSGNKNNIHTQQTKNYTIPNYLHRIDDQKINGMIGQMYYH